MTVNPEYQPMTECVEVDRNLSFTYMLLDRLRTDCEYFLGPGNRKEKYLWAGNVKDQIQTMRDLLERCPLDEKPEWLTPEKIDNYEAAMEER